MASDPKPTPAAAPAAPHREQGVRIFSYPKVIFLFPTLIVALICGLGMWMVGKLDHPEVGYDAFKRPENLFGVLFLGVFAFNLLVMSFDFPRFTLLAGVIGVLFLIFFVLWVGAYFGLDLMSWARGLLGNIYLVANAGFYFCVVFIMLAIYAVVFIGRYLDYWEIRPNEILHHHGPLSDLERFPTLNLKFDKEIPDVLEYIFLGSGRVVLQIPGQPRAIVLDNVLFINSLEKAMKTLMSRMEVRLTTDQEAAAEN